MNEKSDSIFRRYYSNEAFVDRFLVKPESSVDVIIPVIHTNELWETNLLSIYREIPVNRLLIGDGGCIDDSIEIAKKFPRVEVLDHRSYVSLGYSLRKLIEAVETPWFVYVHSDVYLPDGWFETMKGHQSEYDWFGCPMRLTVMVEYPLAHEGRPYAGSQMGRKAAFEKGVQQIDDDYVYRQEDFVLASIVEQAGFKHGKVEDTFHYHQTMHKPTPWARKVKNVQIDLETSREEEVRNCTMQSRGIVKYLEPDSSWVTYTVATSLNRLFELGELNSSNWPAFKQWVMETNPEWVPYLPKRRPIRRRLRLLLGRFLQRVLY
ncbi:MAG TPA: glycosyltransferase family A protein [Pyrinomonadaceae bacterium]|nr:glycosyltransferase family A protein [Pyrinomonadaceae bacterium]